ncbi:MAG TPA: glycosyltransferase family 2 protein [Myxococcota bacterium]|jgi:glycosyltransferase involved in cell wall biosynthesis
MSGASTIPFSVVIPAFNEERGIVPTLRELRETLRGLDYEIIVVDDGSRDRTAELARAEGVTVVQQPLNRGYGASLKTGIRRATHDVIVITDADGTYPASAIPALVAGCDVYEMVVGARVGANVAIPLVRRPAKWVLGKLASYLAGRPIPDLNSGLRAMRRDLVEQYEHLLPSGFSFTTTITLSALCRDHLVRFDPIDYRARAGDSKIRPRHAYDFFLLILRTIVYFNPLKIFLPVGALFFLVGLAKFIYDVTLENLSESAIFAFLTAFLFWGLGLISDQLSRIASRRAQP